jgi:hypothetical protein
MQVGTSRSILFNDREAGYVILNVCPPLGTDRNDRTTTTETIAQQQPKRSHNNNRNDRTTTTEKHC